MTGEVVVVTGGATGIGRAICLAFLDVDEALARWGRIDVLVDNAGISSTGRPRGHASSSPRGRASRRPCSTAASLERHLPRKEIGVSDPAVVRSTEVSR